MSTSVTFNGTSYTVPAIADASWGTNIANYLIAISTGCLQKTGGTFTLTAEVNFGATYGLKAAYLKSQTANIAAAGFLELAKTDTISWRNNANSGDLALTIDSSNRLTFNGVVLETAGVGAIVNADIAAGAAIDFSKLAVLASGNILVGSAGGVATSVAMSGDVTVIASGATAIGAGKVTNTMLAGAIAYSKLTLTGAIVNGDLAGSIAYSKLTLTGSIVTGDIASGLVLSAANGGTGVGNNAAATLTRSGNHAVTLTTTNTTGLTLPTTGTLSTLAGAEVITNKDHDGGTASNTSRLTVPSAALTTLTALTRKAGTIVYDTTSSALLADDGTNLNSIGGGSGEKNYVTAPSTASGWVASNTGITVATTTTGLPRANTTKSGILITGVSGTTDYVRYRFIMDDADANTKMKFQFAMEPGTMVASDFELRVYSNTASDYTTGNTRLSLSTDNSTPATLLPALTGTYRTTFDAPATSAKYLEVRIKMAAAQVHTLVISDVIVGPGVVVQGAAVSGWTTYTPLLRGDSNGSTFTNQTTTAAWRRVGDAIEIQADTLFSGTPGTATGAYTIDLPSGFTINTTAVAAATGRATLGVAAGAASGSATTYSGAVVGTLAGYQSGNACVLISSAAAAAHWSATVPRSWASGDYMSIHFTVPVNEYVGSGTINVAQNDAEYASNSDTSDAADTTHFAYGPAGSPNPVSLTAVRNKRVRFPTPIQPTDVLILELQAVAAGSPWFQVAVSDGSTGACPLMYQGAKTYGVGFNSTLVNSTDIDVAWGQYMYASSTTTYAAAGTAWTSLYNWRVRKMKGGQAVGFSEVNPGVSSGLVSASGVKGAIAGASISTGYVGEILETTIAGSVSLTSATYADTPAGGLTLTPGVWDLQGNARFVPAASTSITRTLLFIGTASGNSATGQSQKNQVDTFQAATVPTDEFARVTPVFRVNISASTTYYLKSYAAFTVSTLGSVGYLRATRIA